MDRGLERNKKKEKKGWRKVHNVDIYKIVLLNMSFTLKKLEREEEKKKSDFFKGCKLSN